MKVSRQVIMQGLKQTFCIPLIYIKHGFRLPKNSQCSKVDYRLPFDGEWTVVNGGLEKEYCHLGGPTQRYAYDFLIMSESGKTYRGDNPADVSAYKCYGKEILTPADGTIVESGVNCEDGKIMLPGDMEAMAKDIRGNYVLIKHAEIQGIVRNRMFIFMCKTEKISSLLPGYRLSLKIFVYPFKRDIVIMTRIRYRSSLCRK